MTILGKLSFCSSDPCSSPEVGLPHHEGIKKPSFLACSWRMRKKKMKKQEKRHHHHHHNPEPIMADSISMDVALQEWFAKSPSVENKRIIGTNNDGGEDCGSNKVNNSVSSSGQFSSLQELLNSSELTTTSMETEESGSSADSSSRDLSLSLEKLLMMREKKKVEIEVGLYSMAKTKSMSRERKVSFRLPEASDIIILNSPQR